MPVNANTGNQTTQYVYGSTLADSAIASSLLKVAEVYPDSVDSDDRIKFTYNRQGEVVTKTDQNGTVHAYDFDKLGRQIQDRVTTLGTGVDTAVKRIARTFEVRGMAQNITSYDNATVGSGSIVNDVQLAYNMFGQVIADYQSHSGAVNVATTPKVQYTYASGSANTIRPLTMVSPNGRVLNYSYGTAGSASDALSRIAALVDNDGTTQLAAYQYLGLGAVVEGDYTQPDIKYTLTDLSSANDPDTGDIYSGLDRFSRVKDCRWYNYGTSADAARLKHGYDRAGNRLYRQDPVAASNSKAFDELYAYDAIYRLRDMQRGTLNGSKTGLTAGTRTFEQCWTLDPTGNWKGFREDSDGNGTWDLVQSRTDNKVNEITGISNSVGSAWATPAYNRAGNMTTVPQPADPTKGYTATYDAWNRLVKLVDVPTGQTVQENAYDGRTFRVVKKSYTAGVLIETRQLFFSTGWQVVEERIGAATAAERQFVWGLRYIDDLVVRDRDTTGGGTLNERLYPLQDANWNAVALASSGGTIQERYAYSAYGVPTVLTGAFAARGTSSYVWEVLFCGYRWDAAVALYLVRNRSYSGTAGVWLQRDPLGAADTPTSDHSLYVSLASRPYHFQDPLGAEVCRYDRDTKCTDEEVSCIESILDEIHRVTLEAIRQGINCFNKSTSTPSDRRKELACRKALPQCIMKTIESNISIRCDDCTANTAESRSSSWCMARKHAGKSDTRKLPDGTQGGTDKSCDACPNEDSVITLCRGLAIPRGNPCQRTANAPGAKDLTRELIRIIVHELLHHCVGAHAARNETDRLGRPDAGTAAIDFMNNCGGRIQRPLLK